MARSCVYGDIGRRKILTKPPRRYEIAIKVAEASEYRPYKMGAAIFNGKAPISFGINRLKSHTMQSRYGGKTKEFLHAEIHALTLTRAPIGGSKIFVARVKADGSHGDSRPCMACAKALKDRGVKSMVYHEQGKIFEEKL